jgi:hypothetical protein
MHPLLAHLSGRSHEHEEGTLDRDDALGGNANSGTGSNFGSTGSGSGSTGYAAGSTGSESGTGGGSFGSTAGSTGSVGTTYGGSSESMRSTTGTSTGGSTSGTTGGYTAEGRVQTDEGGEGMLDRARDAVSDMAGRARDALSDVADAAGDLAGRASDRMGGTVPAVTAVVGALAATVGGWWAMHAGRDTKVEVSEEEERHFRSHFDTHPPRGAGGLTYEDARTGYALGHTASRNPSYQGRRFDEVEPELRSGFGDPGSYDTLRDFTRYGYERGTGRGDQGGSTEGGAL